MTLMTLTRRDFVSTASLAVFATATAANALNLVESETARSSTAWRIGLVQSAPWDIELSRMQEDTTRNLARMLEVIDRQGPECDWLAFNDCPLTGRSISMEPSATQIEALRAAARRHDCAVSFGCGAGHRALLVSANETEVQYGPLVSLNGRRIAIVSAAQSPIATTTLDSARVEMERALQQGAEALLIMRSGPNAEPTWIIDIAAGLPLLHVSAACDTHIPGHTSDWLGGTRARDTHGLTLGHIAHAEEGVLQVQLLFSA